ncbi:MAG: DUF1638 domain-containing protein [bacterium]|jgi:hypothetical protein
MAIGFVGSKYKLYACLNLQKEIEYIFRHCGAGDLEIEYLDFGYHRMPEKLPPYLQERLQEDKEYDAILLGYGLCSKAVLGLQAVYQPLVIPKVHDCIALFLGSQKRYNEIFCQCPDKYFLTCGWLAEGVDPLTEYEEWREKYGVDTAQWLKQELYGNYRTLCLLDTGVLDSPYYHEQAVRVAEFLNASFEIYKADLDLLRKLLIGQWDENFLIVKPGEEIMGNEFD